MSRNKLLRVSQMDAVYLNNELTNMFQNQMHNCLEFLPAGEYIKYQKEVSHLVKMLLSSYSIFNHDCTFGQKMLLIKYANITSTKKYLYVFFGLLDYLKDKLEDVNSNKNILKYCRSLHSLFKFICFVNLCLFIKYGKYPLLIERILGLEQIYSKDFVQRRFGSKYLSRELLWNGLIEVLVYILPLINYPKIMRISRGFLPLRKQLSTSKEVKYEFTHSTKCACCKETPVLPHHMNCLHVFCYTCLKANLQADSGFECPLCGHKNSSEVCERVTM